MAKRSKPSKSKTPKRRGWFSKLFRFGLISAVIGLIAIGTAVAMAWSTLPGFVQMKQSPNGQMIRVRAADGTVIVSMGPVFGEWLHYKDIPSDMVDAMVSVEDRRFRSHFGVDPVGIARSFKVRIEKGHFTQGGSTITQQLARNVFLTNDKTWSRKFREMILAMALERKFSKDQILELYLNRVYFGGGAYGIDAASRKFFAHPAKQLSLGEAAIIAGLVKAPSNYSPTADAKAAIGRAGVVLQSMVDAGVLAPGEVEKTNPAGVKLAPEAKQNSVRYFTDWALPQLDSLISETDAPIDVWTSLDLRMQNAADAAIRGNVPKGTQGALVAIDRDGAIRAMVGGTDYVSSIYNRSTQAVRQPGSAFKLFVYLAALEAGYTVDTKVVDEAVEYGGWTPKNSSGRFSGEIDLRTAFAYSVNTIAAKIGADVGTSAVADMARRFGITTPINTLPSMVLGTSDVRLLDLTRAYASLAAKGTSVTPYGITKVTTEGGRVLYQRQAPTGQTLVPPHVSGQMVDLLQTAVNTGTGKAAQIGRPVAGKTGTTSSNKDGWFMGFSSGLTAGVWMGRDDARPVSGLQGGSAPARAFAAFMRVAVAGRKIEAFDTKVTLPDWKLDNDEQAYIGNPDNGMFVDEKGNPLPESGVVKDDVRHEEQPPLDQKFIDDALGRVERVPDEPAPQ
jgi:penicillin-binding protein 1A